MNTSTNATFISFPTYSLSIAQIILSSAWFYYISVALGILGILINLIILVLSCAPKLIQGDYKKFVFNSALMDMTCSLSGLIIALQILFPQVILQTTAYTFVEGLLGYYGIIMSIIGLFPLMISRYFITEFSHLQLYERFFTKKLIIFYCFFIDLLPLPLVIACNLPSTSAELKARLQFAFWLIVLLCLLGVMILAYLTHRSVKKHMKMVGDLQQRQRIKETKELLRATLIEGLAPIVCQGPLFIFIVLLYLIIPNASPLALTSILDATNYVQICSVIGTMLNPVVDGLVTLTLLKQYRHSLKTVIKSLMIRLKLRKADQVTAAKSTRTGTEARKNSSASTADQRSTAKRSVAISITHA